MIRRLRTGMGDPERGSVSLFWAITIPGLLILIGLVGDGGAKLRATQRADQIAAEAARSAGQALDAGRLQAGDGASADPTRAVQTATAFLDAAGVSGTVTVSADRTTIDVAVTSTAPTAFLSLIGITTLTVTGHAQARLVHAVSGAGP